MGSLSAVAGYPGLQGFLETFGTAVSEGGSAHESWQELNRALGVELASYQSSTPGETSALDVLRALLFERNVSATEPSADASAGASDVSAPAEGVATWLVKRGTRGFALPGPALLAEQPGLMQDGNLPVDARGRFVDSQGQLLSLPTPFAVVGADAVILPGAHLRDCVVWDGVEVPAGDYERCIFYDQGGILRLSETPSV